MASLMDFHRRVARLAAHPSACLAECSWKQQQRDAHTYARIYGTNARTCSDQSDAERTEPTGACVRAYDVDVDVAASADFDIAH